MIKARKQLLLLSAISITLVFIGLYSYFTLFSSGSREIAPLTNIFGIEFPAGGVREESVEKPTSTIITEKLSHADIYLKEPVLAKQLVLTLTFTPLDTQQISIGIRANPFWLSYKKQVIYDRGPGETPLTRTVTIPLTDKLADKDGSVDLMIFSENSNSTDKEYIGINDTTLWYLHDIKAEIHPIMPTKAELKDYLKSQLTREKPQ